MKRLSSYFWLDNDFEAVFGKQVAESLYQLLFVGIVLSEIDGEQQLVFALTHLGIDGGQCAVIIELEPTFEQVAAFMLLAIGAVTHHYHGVLNGLEEAAQYIDNGSSNTKVDGMRFRPLSLDAKRKSVQQIGIDAANRGKIQVIPDTVSIDKHVVKFVNLPVFIRESRK